MATSKKTLSVKKKVVAKKAPASKPVKAPTKTKTAAKKVEIKKAAPAKKVPAKVAKKAAPKPKSPVKKVVPAKAKTPAKVVKPEVKSKVAKPVVKKPEPISSKATKETKSKVVAKEVVKPSKEVSSKKDAASKAKLPVLPTIKGSKNVEDKPEPLQLKAQKAIKELEERMDLSKVRPRLQAGSPPPAKSIPKAHAQPLKLIEPTNTIKEKFQLEFEFRASPRILYNYISDSSGLAGWFADEVKTKDNLFTFEWEGSESYARLVASREYQLARFQWTEEVDGTYFQFEIKEDDLTGDVALIITDFANPGEKDANIRLWESQVQQLRMLLGSF
jgi:uncharacterized protein YndB with AHSA1/START domain